MQEGTFDLFELLRTLWRGRVLIAAITSIFAIGGVLYALLATEWFKADVVMAQVDNNKSLSGNLAQLGGLASLAGISIGNSATAEVPVAVLRSKDLARQFIEDRNLTKVLLVDKIDVKTGDWKERNPAKQPDIRDAVEYFQKKICVITEDKKTALVTLSITWRYPAVSAEWANELAERVNTKLRNQAVAEAEQNIKYLKDEIAATNITSLQQSMGRVLESEMQKLMLARGNEQFAFKVIDRSVAPRRRAGPTRIVLVMSSTILGFLASVVVVVGLREIRERRKSANPKSLGDTAASPGP